MSRRPRVIDRGDGTTFFVTTTSYAMKLFVVGLPEVVRQAGRKVVIVCPEDAWVREYSDRVAAEFLPVEFERDINPRADLLALARIWFHLRKLQPDTIVVGSPKASLLSAFAGFVLGVRRRVYVLHGLRYESAVGIKRAVLETMEVLTCMLSTDVIAVSKSAAETINGKLPKIRQARVLGWGSANGIDTLRFFLASNERRANLRDSLNLGDQPVIGYVGRFAKDKGVDLLPEFFLELDKICPGIQFVVAGRDEKEPETRKSRQLLEKMPAVHLVGEVDRPEDIYQCIDVLVSPTMREGLGMSLVEAGACGVPVVASKVTGCVDVVTENLVGTLVDSRDPKDWAVAVEGELSNSEDDRSVRRSELMKSRYDRRLVASLWESELASRS